MEIIIPILVCLAIAVVCAILLTVATSLFGVKEDERFAAVREALPGANCGACGYSGCDGYARALCDGKTTSTGLCTPGGAETSEKIAELLGLEAAKTEKRVAFVACNGTCGATAREEKHFPSELTSCKEASAAWNGEGVCHFSCVGLGDCASVCPEEAIVIGDGVAKVVSSRCLGCGICEHTCPRGIISMLKVDALVSVVCSNHDKGALTRKLCTNGCIGCTKCVRVCPHGAITMEENLAVIDCEKCTGCGACAEACPVHAIRNGSFICDRCL